MKYVPMIYQGPTPTLPGSDRWKALPEAEQKAIYADYAATTNAAGVTPGLPSGLYPVRRGRTVRGGVNGKLQVKTGTYLAEGVGGYMVLEAREYGGLRVCNAPRRSRRRGLGGAVEIRSASEQYWERSARMDNNPLARRAIRHENRSRRLRGWHKPDPGSRQRGRGCRTRGLAEAQPFRTRRRGGEHRRAGWTNCWLRECVWIDAGAPALPGEMMPTCDGGGRTERGQFRRRRRSRRR